MTLHLLGIVRSEINRLPVAHNVDLCSVAGKTIMCAASENIIEFTYYKSFTNLIRSNRQLLKLGLKMVLQISNRTTVTFATTFIASTFSIQNSVCINCIMFL